MRYTISEMAALLGGTTHTLRYYEKMGLIQPEVNRETGYRYYTVTDTRRVNLCRELRAKLALHEGVPAEQILCGGSPLSDRGKVAHSGAFVHPEMRFPAGVEGTPLAGSAPLPAYSLRSSEGWIFRPTVSSSAKQTNAMAIPTMLDIS